MRISTFGYVGKQGVKNIWRNKMFSLASIATMSACIFLFGLFFSIIVNFQHIIKTAEEGVAITVFFEEDATDSEKKAIGKALEARKDVCPYHYAMMLGSKGLLRGYSYFDFFYFALSVAKYSFVRRTTVPDSKNSAIKFGIAIRPLKVSAILHIRPRFAVAPKIATRE